MDKGRSSGVVLIVTVLLGLSAGNVQAEAFWQTMVNQRLTWMQWWETNRDVYLQRALEMRGQLPAAASDEKKAAIAKAEKALQEASRSQDRDVRAEAALALARMGKGQERLLELTRDPDQRVRCRAWVGLGLLDDEKDLLERADLDAAESVAVVTGLGLLDRPGDKAMARLRECVKGSPSAEVSRMALWALRVHPHPEDRELVLEALRTRPTPCLAIEAITTLGAVGDARDLAGLTEIGYAGPEAQKLPVFTFLKTMGASRSQTTDPALLLRGAACLALAQMPADVRTRADTGAVNQDVVRAANMLSQNAFKYQSEVIRSDGHNIYYTPCSVYPGMATLGLAQYNGPELLLDMLKMKWPPITGCNPEKLPWQPPRGYAAMALGVYAGSRVSDLSYRDRMQDKKDRNNAVNTLRVVLESRDEPRHLRAACALALGLSGDTSYADPMVRMTEKGRLNDELIGGHIILGLGLMGDQRALGIAQGYLGSAQEIDVKRIGESSAFENAIVFVRPAGEPPDISNEDGVLARRAAVLGLAALADRRAGPMLLAQWGQNQWVSLEAAKAMGACGVYEGTDSLIALMKNASRPRTAALAAKSLGEMLDLGSPSRLSRLVSGNYPGQLLDVEPLEWLTLPTPGSPRKEMSPLHTAEREFQGLGNPFLYWHLLPRKASWLWDL